MGRVKANGFLYSLWSGGFKVYEGIVTIGDFTNLAMFRTKTKLFQCSIEPEEMYNAVIWLTERDDELAKQIFIDYEETRIMALEERIDNHRKKIETIKKS